MTGLGFGRWGRIACAAIALATAAMPVQAEDFYKGKTINVIIGYSPGGGFDLYARVLAKYMGRHIPGNPTLIPQNMPGAASLKAVEYLVGVAPKDGTVFGTFSHTISIAPLLGEAKFDPTKLEWLGSVTDDTAVCIAWAASPIKTWDDLKTKQGTFGGTGRGSDPDQFVTLAKNVMGVPIKLVTGYPGTSDLVIASERGELDGFCGLSYSTITSRYRDWIEQKKVNILIQAAMVKNPELPNVPLVLDLATTEKQKQILTLFTAAQSMARPFAMPPGTSKERVEIMRTAFMDTLKDPDFLAEAKQSKMGVNPISAKEILSLLEKVYATPPDVVQDAIKALE